MWAKSRVLAVVLCLFVSTVAVADSINSVTPSQIAFGNVEEFLTLSGSGLAGSASTMVVFDGIYSIEPQNVDPGGTSVIVWIPAEVLFIEGRHSVEVVATDLTGAVRHSGPGYFSISSNPDPGTDGPPTIQVPENVIGEATNREGGVVRFDVIGTSANGDVADVTCDHESGTFFPFGTTRVLCTATDTFGSASDTFSVIVTDSIAPVVTVPADFTSPTAVVTYSVSAADNIDGSVAVSCSPASGTTFRSGTSTINCVAFDTHLNPGYGSFNVTVTNGAPTITVPDEITAAATSPAGAAVTFSATATGTAVITCSPASGSTFAIGETLVTCTATNAAGSDSGSFVVTVYDGPPVLTLPDDIDAEATSAAGAVVTFEATATDAVDGTVTVTCDPASGSTFPLGTTTVTCSAKDSLDHEATGSFDVTVADTTPPEFVILEATPNTLWPPNHNMVAITVNAVVYDAVDSTPVTQIISVTSNQPINGTGDGDVGPDWNITGPLTLQLRSERSSGVDRIYTITVQTVDDAGNVNQKTVQVKVTQSSAKTRRR